MFGLLQLAEKSVRHRRGTTASRLTELQRRAMSLEAAIVKSQRRQVAKEPVGSGRQLNGAAALLAFSVLADSALEHYRGNFQNKAMYTPLLVASLTLGGSLFGVIDPKPKRHLVRDGIYACAALTGLTGLCFHAFNVVKRPGGLSWHNLFYAAPIGAPMALLLSGGFGRAAEKVRDTPVGERVRVLGVPAGKLLNVITSIGLIGTVAEAALLHFRGAFHNHAMYLPVTVPPTAATLLAACLAVPGTGARRVARWGLKATAALGLAGCGFHAYGISRNMGGWRNWSQNLLVGPPLPAPPSFTGIAIAGLAALTLMEAGD